MNDARQEPASVRLPQQRFGWECGPSEQVWTAEDMQKHGDAMFEAGRQQGMAQQVGVAAAALKPKGNP